MEGNYLFPNFLSTGFLHTRSGRISHAVAFSAKRPFFYLLKKHSSNMIMFSGALRNF